MTAEELFQDINTHLLNDAKPSDYLESIKSALKDAPFDIFYKMRRTMQSPKYHPEGSVWNHTLLTADAAARVKNRSKNPRALLWAALLHDVGKPLVSRRKGDRIVSYNHERAGAKLAKAFLSRFTDDAAFINDVYYLVLYHMQPLFVVKEMPFQDIRGLRAHTDVDELALLGLCDRLGRGGSDRAAEEKNMRTFIEKCHQYTEVPMAKAGMRRPDPKEPHGTESNKKTHLPKNDVSPVPELGGKAKTGNKKAPK